MRLALPPRRSKALHSRNIRHIRTPGRPRTLAALPDLFTKGDTMKRTLQFRPALLALACALLLPLAAAAEPVQNARSSSPESASATKTLYERLGGYDALSAVTKDLAGRLVADPKLGRFWAHRGKDGVDREVQLIVDFLAAKSGGPLYYRGREMKLSHVGMKIDGEDWAALIKHLNATLDKFSVPAKEHAEVVAFIESTRGDIVELR